MSGTTLPLRAVPTRRYNGTIGAIFSGIQDEILNCLQKNPYATVKEVQMQFKSMTIDGIQYHIRRLKSMGLLKRIGPDKGGYWQVMDMQ